MDPILQVGKGGITETVVTQTDEAKKLLVLTGK